MGWVKYSSVGARAGTDLKDSSGNVLADNAVKNTSITISDAGALSGAGGGSVTKAGAGIPTIFRDENPPTALAAGDIWIDLNDSNKMYRSSAAGSGSWVAATVQGMAAIGESARAGYADRAAAGFDANGDIRRIVPSSYYTNTTYANLAALDSTANGLLNSANQDSTAAIRAGTTAANVGLGNLDFNLSLADLMAQNFTGTIGGVANATVRAGAAAGATANQDTTSSILGGNLTGTINGTAVGTVVTGAAAGASATTAQVDKANFILWTNISGQLSPSFTSNTWTITWYVGGSSAGTTVITASTSGSTALSAMYQNSNSASASVSLGGVASSGNTQTTTATKGGVTVTLRAEILDGSGWNFSKG